MSNKTNDLNPKNERFNDYQVKSKNIASRQASSIYKDKFFAEEYQPVFISAVSLRFVCSIVSAATLLVASYLALCPILGLYLSLSIGIAFCGLFEVLKTYTWRITSKQILKYKRASYLAIVVLLGIHLVSFGGSCFGAWHLPNIMNRTAPPAASLLNLDSINSSYLSQLATMDNQLKKLSEKTNSSTIRAAINNITKQKKTLLNTQNTAIAAATETNSTKIEEHKDQVLEDAKNHKEKIKMNQYSCIAGTAFFELLFILCSVFISYYLFRQFIDENEQEQEQENIQASTDILSEGNNNGTRTTGEPAPTGKRPVIVQGFIQEGKRQEASVKEVEYTKICALDSCKAPFLHSIHNQKYCTTDCRKLAYEKRKYIKANFVGK